MKLKSCLILFFFYFISNSIHAQNDSTQLGTEQAIQNLRDSLRNIRLSIGEIKRDLTFSGTRIIDREVLDSAMGTLIIHGYVGSYYALYSDSIKAGRYQQFPTEAPTGNTIGLDIAQIGMRYVSERTHANLTLHTGDIPASCWSSKFNFIQEANAGFRIAKRLWLDMGFFRTHIGLESIQPRENITSSIAITSYFEPYFMSGAKLTYKANEKLYIQANVFNSFNTFIETNDRKAIGISTLYEPTEYLSITFNSLLNDNHPIDSNQTLTRIYNNFYLVWRKERWTIGCEANLGLEEAKKNVGTHGWKGMCSSLLAAKYSFGHGFSGYGRLDYFSDPHEILTGPVYNDFHKLIGLQVASYTAGMEWKPSAVSYVRIESRWVQTAAHQPIFYLDQIPNRNRYEGSLTMGVWF